MEGSKPSSRVATRETPLTRQKRHKRGEFSATPKRRDNAALAPNDKFWSSFFKSLRRWRARSPPRASQRAKHPLSIQSATKGVNFRQRRKEGKKHKWGFSPKIMQVLWTLASQNGCCPFMKVFDRPFFKKVALVEAAKPSSRVATRETPPNGVFFLIAFSFAPFSSKEKAANRSCEAKPPSPLMKSF